MKRPSIFLFALATALAACGGAATTYTATLSGANEVPATSSAGTGTVTATLNGAALNVTGSYTGLSGAATAAHIHGPASTTEAAAVVSTCMLTATAGATAGDGTLSGSCSSVDAAALNGGQWYVNIHTALNSSGEIRGQLMKQ